MRASGNRDGRKREPKFCLTLFSAAFVLPLSPDAGWRNVTFARLKPNVVEFSQGTVRMRIDGSSSPLLLSIDPPREVSFVSAKGSLTGVPRLKAGKAQGDDGNDDYALRLGLVRQGDRRLGWVARLFAPEWLKRLDETIQGDGVGRIDFFLIASEGDVGAKKTRSGKIKIEEEIAAVSKTPGRFSFRRALAEGPPVVGMWLQADGDDTGSKFEVEVTEIGLEGK